MSPFLFIIVVDGLGRLIKASVCNRKLKGLSLWGEELTITHQQFVDDVMLYSQANLKEVKKLLEILEEFTNASGIEINKDKIEIFFFNTLMLSQAFLARTMGFRIGKFPTKYLGVQLSDKQNRIVNWGGLIGKIQKRVDN